MRKLCLLVVLAVSGLLVGCQQTPPPQETHLLQATGHNGLNESDAERQRRIYNIDNFNKRMLIDDWDTLWSYEKSSHLTYYDGYIGRGR